MNKTYHLTINSQPYTLTLTPPPQWGYCLGCKKETSIRVISQPLNSLKRRFCGTCGLKNLAELTTIDYEFKEPETIKEIRSQLLKNSEEELKEEIFDCYE